MVRPWDRERLGQLGLEFGLQRGQLRLQRSFVLGQCLGEQCSLLRRHGFGLGAELPTLQPGELDVDLLQPSIAESDLAVLALELALFALELAILALELAILAFDRMRLLLDVLAHPSEHCLHWRGQLVLVDRGHVVQTKHVRHRATSRMPAPLAQAPLRTPR